MQVATYREHNDQHEPVDFAHDLLADLATSVLALQVCDIRENPAGIGEVETALLIRRLALCGVSAELHALNYAPLA